STSLPYTTLSDLVPCIASVKPVTSDDAEKKPERVCDTRGFLLVIVFHLGYVQVVLVAGLLLCHCFILCLFCFADTHTVSQRTISAQQVTSDCSTINQYDQQPQSNNAAILSTDGLHIPQTTVCELQQPREPLL